MNKSEFQLKTSQTEKPVIVDFWAPRCAPCRITKPILEKLAQEYDPKVEFLAVNADESSELLEQFNVIGIPAVLALRNGKVVGRVMGAQNETGYRTVFEALVRGEEVRMPLSDFDRVLRLTAGSLLTIVGLSTGAWFLLGIGGGVAFLGLYDRCPLWAAITRRLR